MSFFRTPSARLRPAVEPDPTDPILAEPDECEECSFDGGAQSVSSRTGYDAGDAVIETGLFAGASASPAGPPESDELDIPAFLRRSH